MKYFHIDYRNDNYIGFKFFTSDGECKNFVESNFMDDDPEVMDIEFFYENYELGFVKIEFDDETELGFQKIKERDIEMLKKIKENIK